MVLLLQLRGELRGELRVLRARRVLLAPNLVAPAVLAMPAILALVGWRLRGSNALSGGGPSGSNPFRSPDPTPPEGADPSASVASLAGRLNDRFYKIF